MSVDILGTNCDRCRSMVQYSFTSTETRRLVRTDSPGRPPQLSRSSWTMCDETCPFTLVTNANVYNQLEWWNVPMKFDNKCQCRKTMSSTRAVLKNLHAGGHVGSRNRKRGWDVKKKKKKKKKNEEEEEEDKRKIAIQTSLSISWSSVTYLDDKCHRCLRTVGPMKWACEVLMTNTTGRHLEHKDERTVPHLAGHWCWGCPVCNVHLIWLTDTCASRHGNTSLQPVSIWLTRPC